ncbi:MAG TPA: ribonuclease P protein component [Rhodanobacteraceae bacterium]|jgi:ribonuclease P protein component|nr:ribonuclease P protein component [Rhodanobacteraceae bacterium]
MAGLPPAARLRRASDFAALRHAERWQGRHFLLRWLKLPEGNARLGLAVSRKVSKRAVERNRIKRVVRESFRAEREGLPALDILVIPRASAAGAPNPALFADLGLAWRKLKTLKQTATPGTIGG